MKPRVGVYLSEHMAAQLAVAAKRPGATKSALVEAALDCFLGSDDDIGDTAIVARQLTRMSRQLDHLDRDLKIVNETVALHARFHLAVTPLLPTVAQQAACALGAERFEEFAAQVGRRVHLGTPLMRETLDRLSAARPEFSAHDPVEDGPPGTRFVIDEQAFHASIAVDDVSELAPREDDGNGRFPVQEPVASHGNNECEAEAAQRRSAPTWRVTVRRVAKDLVEGRSLIIRVFLPFVAGYYLSFLFRSINALIAGSLSTELGLGARDLSLLTSVYFLTFAAAQIPIGVLLDRYGPRRIQSAFLVIAAAGAALFGASDNFLVLLAGRALIGLGVAAALSTGLKALILWFPKDRLTLLNGLMVMLAALGAVTATLPAELLLVYVSWRSLFELLAAVTAGCAFMIHLVVPEVASTVPVSSGAVAGGLRAVYTDRRFWRLAPLSATCIGTAWALQGLWAAQWLTDVEGLDRAALVQHLFAMAVALSLGALLLGVTADRLRRRGIGPQVLLGVVAAVFITAQLALILRWPLPSYILWAIVAAVGAATVLSYAILAEHFPKELAGRANAALNVFHIGGAFVLQYATGVVLQHWMPEAGHYPEIAYQVAFALNLSLQIAALVWFMFPRVGTYSRQRLPRERDFRTGALRQSAGST
jgi:MFS family permease